MYYLFTEKGAIYNQFNCVPVDWMWETAEVMNLTCIYYTGASQDAWEHGIKVMAPSPENKEFVYWAEYQRPTLNEGKPFRHTFTENSLENAMEYLENLIEGHGRQDLLGYGIEERITITHKVKI